LGRAGARLRPSTRSSCPCELHRLQVAPLPLARNVYLFCGEPSSFTNPLVVEIPMKKPAALLLTAAAMIFATLLIVYTMVADDEPATRKISMLGSQDDDPVDDPDDWGADPQSETSRADLLREYLPALDPTDETAPPTADPDGDEDLDPTSIVEDEAPPEPSEGSGEEGVEAPEVIVDPEEIDEPYLEEEDYPAEDEDAVEEPTDPIPGAEEEQEQPDPSEESIDGADDGVPAEQLDYYPPNDQE